MEPTTTELETIAYQQILLKLQKAELTLKDDQRKSAAYKVVADYRELLQVMLLGPESDKGQYMSHRNLHLWKKEEIMKYGRFEVKPYTLYGIVDRSSFGTDDPQDGRQGTYELMDIVLGFGVVSVPPSHYVQEFRKIYSDVTSLTPEKLIASP